jgi:hypothetical protein
MNISINVIVRNEEMADHPISGIREAFQADRFLLGRDERRTHSAVASTLHHWDAFGPLTPKLLAQSNWR